MIDMFWKMIHLDYQSIFLDKYGVVNITVAIPFKELKQDLYLKFRLVDYSNSGESDWEMNKWYHHRLTNRYISGVGNLNERYLQ